MRNFVTNELIFKRRLGLSGQDEKVWTRLKQSLREQYPNPHREGCPEEAMLKGLAFGTVRLEQAAAWLDHLGHCSPCFLDFERFRTQASRWRRLSLSLAAAAILLLCLSVTLWLTLRHEQPTPMRGYVDKSTPTAATEAMPSKPLATAVLHFENPSTSRGGNDNSRPPQSLPRSRIIVSIYLPLSDEPGKYELELLKTLTDSAPLATLKGTAVIENGLPVLQITSDLSNLAPGLYVARFRQIGGTWRYSSVLLS
jgi:hypothetical protein